MINLTTLKITEGVRRYRVLCLLLIGLSLSACGGGGNDDSQSTSAPPESGLAIKTVAWDASELRLGLSGSIVGPALNDSTAGQSDDISVNDANTEEVLATLPVGAGNNEFSTILDELTSVPCALTIKRGVAKSTVSVQHSPVGCAQLVNPDALALTVREAEWEDGRTLEIKGVAPVPNTVTIRYAGSDAVLSEVPVNDRRGRSTGIWKVKFTGFDATKVPCALAVTAGGETLEVAVENAPEACVGTPGTPPPEPNQPPAGTITSPTAAAVTITAGSAVTFAGSGTDPDNNVPLSYLWDFGGGATNSTVDNPGAVLFATAGTYTVKLIVTDSLGLADPNPPARVITVTASNQPPVPVNQAPTGTITSPATDVTVAAGASVTFEGSGTDPENNTPLSFAWTFGGAAPDVATQNPGSIVLSVPGTYTVKLTVTDALGVVDPNPPTRTVTVTTGGTGNQPPVGTIVEPAGNVSIAPGASVTFQGNGTDPDNNTPLAYAWSFGGGATDVSTEDPGAVVFATAGTYTVKLTVTDALGLADPNPPTRTVTVTTGGTGNQPPTGTITAPTANVSIAPGASVTFQGNGTDPDNNTPLTYAWSFGGGATDVSTQNPGAVVFATAGTYTIKLTVTDALGVADLNPPTRTVTVTTGGTGNQPPTGTITAPTANVSIAPGASVTFQGNGSDPDNNTPLAYAWSFGGGATDVSTQNPGAVVFATAGTYTVKLTVTDALGVADLNPPTRVITVGGTPAAAPLATITAPAADVEIKAGESVTFTGTGTDPGGLTLIYDWHFGGGAKDVAVASPGPVTFDTPGIYPVLFHVTNSAGVRNDANAVVAKRLIKVGAPATGAVGNVLVGNAHEGLSTPDIDYTVMSVLPLNNSLRAQILATNATPAALPKILDNTAATLSYKGTADGKSSITTTSSDKTNFWPNVNTQFAFVMPPSTVLQPDQGLQGVVNTRSQLMPGTANAAQPLGTFTAAAGANLFEARVIPLVPLNDAKQAENYPLFRLAAIDSANTQLAQLDVVLPVGNAMNCATGCHATGGVAADAAETARLGGGITWSTNTDPANQAKENIWIIHAALHGLPVATTTNDTCTRCHYTPLADPDGAGPKGTQQTNLPSLSLSVHRLHGLSFSAAPPTATAPPVITDDQCSLCHESGAAKLNRGAMFSAGAVCKDCHGGLLAVGAQADLKTTPPRRRVAYVDQPRCESCHIGDAVSENGGTVVLAKAYDPADPSATPKQAATSRYAQEPAKGFATSVGHGKLTCPACHGTTHAEWPVDDPLANDNVTPTQLQGHRGVLTECDACHVGGLDVTKLGGPHGLHAINDPGWVYQHGPIYTADPAVCRACHGLTLDGGYLSRAAIARNFVKKDDTPIAYTPGQVVGCADCHAKPL